MRLRSVLCAAALFLRVAFSQPVAPPKQAPSQIQPPSYDDLVAKALSLLAEKKAKESVSASEQAIAVNDKRWEAYASAASAYSAQRLYDDTIGMLQMALGRAPEGKKQAIRDALTAARRQIAAESAANGSQPARSAERIPAQAVNPQETELWKAIENSTRAEDYQGYLSKYPDGTFAPIAKTRLDAILRNQTGEGAKDGRNIQSQTPGESALWMSIKDSHDPEDYRAYLDKYPDGTFAPIAKRRVAEMSQAKLNDVAGSTWNFRLDWIYNGGFRQSAAVDSTDKHHQHFDGQISFAPDGSCAYSGQNNQPCRWVKRGDILTVTEDETQAWCQRIWTLTITGPKMTGSTQLSGVMDKNARDNCPGSQGATLTAR